VSREVIDAALLTRARRQLRAQDPKLAALIARVGPCVLRPRTDPYRELVRSVLFQQLAGAAARAIEARLKVHFGGRVPRADRLAATPSEVLRELGLSRQKAETIRSVADAFASGRLASRRLRRMDDAEVVEAVTELRGIGEWTAHMLLIFCLGRPDVLPVGDYGVRKGAQSLYDLAELPKRAQLETLAEPWRPYRSIASWYLWRQND